MVVKTEGIIIREIPMGESDKFLSVLTPDQGKISVYANGVRSMKSPFLNSAQLLCYNEFMLNERGGKYWLKEIAVIERFPEVREDIVSYALAQYFMDVANDVCMEAQPELDMYRLVLNALYAMSTGKFDMKIIKAVYELRVALYSGFMPELVSCGHCGHRLTQENMLLDPLPDRDYGERYLYMDILNGLFTCKDCFARQKNAPPPTETDLDMRTSTLLTPVSESVLAALQYVFRAPANRIFSFKLGEEKLPEFADFCENYLLHHLERDFTTLGFYRAVSKLS